MEQKFLVPKEKLIDTQGRALTQGLFYESQDNKFAVYTLKERDHVVDGITYYSLKRLYLECEDPTEYSFIRQHLYSVSQWERMCANAMLSEHISEWRYELDLKLSSSAIQGILEISTDELASGQLQALKFFAKKEYKDKKPGRPAKGAKLSAEDSFEYSKNIIDIQKRMERMG